MKEDKSIDIDDVAGLASGIHFVSGIDTDAGKTVCTGWLARELMHAGRTVATMKLVQTGCGAFSPDIRVHRRIMGVHLAEDDSLLTAPALFSYPASPHLAAEIDELGLISSICRSVPKHLPHVMTLFLWRGPAVWRCL